MAGSSLFIGVVSHERTRYPTAQGSDGLAVQLGAALTDREVPCTVIIDTSNRFDSEAEPITEADVQESLSAQLEVEDRWSRYVHGPGSLRLKATLQVVSRRLRRAGQRVSPPNKAKVERLLNIELAHRALLVQGLASHASWIVILEDDGWCRDIPDLADGLMQLIQDAESDVDFINLSESFDLAELGVKHLLGCCDLVWGGSADRAVLDAQRPVTNTVCAIAYRASFVRQLLDAYSTMPMRPVVPIDWKLNKALMAMTESGELGAGSCLWVVPGPVDQLSMRGAR